jgi:hypothetical protein
MCALLDLLITHPTNVIGFDQLHPKRGTDLDPELRLLIATVDEPVPDPGGTTTSPAFSAGSDPRRGSCFGSWRSRSRSLQLSPPAATKQRVTSR